MTLKNILIHLDNSSGCPARLDLAINLARTHGANLKGLYAIAHEYYAPRHGGIMESGAKEMQTLFTEKTDSAGILSEWLYVDWSVVGVSITDIITSYTYYTDLVIVGQYDKNIPNNITPADFVERLGLASGRPLLIIPCTGTFTTLGERVIVAWKAGRESVRAVNDALPILKKTKKLCIVSVGSFGHHDRAAEESVHQLCAHLAHHQVAAEHEQILATGFPIAELLLNNARNQKMDLIVMGGYAQTRRGAYVIGPVATSLLTRMTLPILLSH
ncbi:MAG: universal stress protein [Geobacteraceae bacterium]|nr:universal stress protein [Geobacteraceae bacterium]NTW80723.1 universal stress protein [Geobacteraceae bacterium]